MVRVFHTATDETTCLSWSFDSRLLAVGAKDMTTRVHAMDKYSNFKIMALRNHTDSIVGCFFEKDTYDLITLSKNGQMVIWECNLNPEDFIPKGSQLKEKMVGILFIYFQQKKQSFLLQTQNDDDEEDDVDEMKVIEGTESNVAKRLKRNKDETIEEKIGENDNKMEKFFYKKLDRHYLADDPRKEDMDAVLTSVDYHVITRILTVGKFHFLILFLDVF